MASISYAYAQFGTATASTGNHWGSIRARYITGAGTGYSTWTVKLGFFKSGTPNVFWEIGDVSNDYARTCGVVNVTDTGAKLAVQMKCTTPDTGTDATCTLYAIFPCEGLGSRVPDEVPSQAAHDSAKTRTQGSILTAHDLDDTEGTLDIEQTPRLHGTSAPTSAETIVELGVTEVVGLDGSNHLEVEDSTNEANADLTESDGVARTIRAAWEGTDLYAAVVGGDDGTASYDGAWPTGDLEIKGTCRSTQAVRVYDVAEMDTDEIDA